MKPKLSIVVLTYNHSDFIIKALDSFLSQKTSFDYEIVIGDDASKDNTQQILKEYEKKHSNIFNITYRSENIGMLPNFVSTLKACSGEYIAFCEGDDYWTDPLKLQKQVDFLAANPNYGICFHDVMVYNNKTKTLNTDDIIFNDKNEFDIEDLIKANLMHTPSVVLRNDFEIPDWLNDSPIGDWPLYIIQIKNRKIKRLNDKMAVYRVHEESAWSSKSELFRIKRTIKTIDLVLNNVSLNENSKTQLYNRREEFNNTYLTIKGSLYKQFKRWLRSL